MTEEKKVTAGGIMLPRRVQHGVLARLAVVADVRVPALWHSSALNKPTTGTVVAVGDGKNAKVGWSRVVCVVVCVVGRTSLTCCAHRAVGQHGAH